MADMQQRFKLDSRKYNRALRDCGDIALALAEQNAPKAYIQSVLDAEKKGVAAGRITATARACKMFADRKWHADTKNRFALETKEYKKSLIVDEATKQEYKKSKAADLKRSIKLKQKADYARNRRAQQKEDKLSSARVKQAMKPKNINFKNLVGL